MLLLIHHLVIPNEPIIAHLVTLLAMTVHLMKAHLVKVHLQYTNNLSHGGTEELWEKIVLPESGGDPNASNGQYHGLDRQINLGAMALSKRKQKA